MLARPTPWFENSAAGTIDVPTMPIPPFTHSGVLPPYLSSPVGHQRSPYRATIEEFVLRFNTSDERRAILRGLLDYRAALRNVLRITEGLQWLDGSFTEDIEASERRSPGDVDVLTIASFPPLSQLSAPQRDLLTSKHTKTLYRCDAYPLDISRGTPLDGVTYWFSLFSHRRNGDWKGLVAVPLDAGADDLARAAIGLEAAS